MVVSIPLSILLLKPLRKYASHASDFMNASIRYLMNGFTQEQVSQYPQKSVMVGFGCNAVFSVAGVVIDGAKPSRHYYTEFVENRPLTPLYLPSPAASSASLINNWGISTVFRACLA